MSNVTKGKCICGAVKISITDMTDNVGVCHCSTCRNWVGGPFFSIEAGNKVEISGQESMRIYNSSEWAERGFCKQCGTHLFYRIKGNGNHFVLAGLMGPNEKAVLEHQVFIDEKPHFYSFSQDTKTYTGAEVFAMFEEANPD